MSKNAAQKPIAVQNSGNADKSSGGLEAPAVNAADNFSAGADDAKVIWARVKGYPWWPAQILPDREASKRLSHAPKRKEQDTPVMFFGTLEVAWMSKKDISSWCNGLENGYDHKYKNPRFTTALAQVREFLMPNKKRKAPESWWCKPPAFLSRRSRSQTTEASPPESIVSVPANITPSVSTQAATSQDAAAKQLESGKDQTKDTPQPQHRKVKATSSRAASADGRAAKEGSNTAQEQGQAPSAAEDKQLVEKSEHNVLKETRKEKVKKSPRLAGASSISPDEPLSRQVVTHQSPASVHDPPLQEPNTVPKQEPASQTTHIAGQVKVEDVSLMQQGPSTSAHQQLVERVPTPDGHHTPAGMTDDPPPQEDISHVDMTDVKEEQLVEDTPMLDVEPPPQPRFSCWPQGEPLLNMDEQDFTFPEQYFMNKAPTYKHIVQNNYLSKSHKPKRQHKEKIHVCSCSVPGDLYVPGLRDGCGEGCLNRESNIHCDPRYCPAGQRCSNRPFHQIATPKTEVFLTENRGYGVRAVEFIKKGTFVVEYVGEVIDEAEMRQRMAEALQSKEPHFYIMELAQGLYIDARTKGNLARLLNSRCSPNCEAQRWQDAVTGEYRVGIFARKDIPPGEELTYDYHFQHHNKDDPNKSPCLCGAPNCRGTIHMRDQKDPRMRDVKRRIEVFWDGDQVYYGGVVVAFNPRTGKHRVKYDDGDEEELKLDTVPHRWLPNDAAHTSAAAVGPTIVEVPKQPPSLQAADTASSSHQEAPADGLDLGATTSSGTAHAHHCMKPASGQKRAAPHSSAGSGGKRVSKMVKLETGKMPGELVGGHGADVDVDVDGPKMEVQRASPSGRMPPGRRIRAPRAISAPTPELATVEVSKDNTVGVDHAVVKEQQCQPDQQHSGLESDVTGVDCLMTGEQDVEAMHVGTCDRGTNATLADRHMLYERTQTPTAGQDSSADANEQHAAIQHDKMTSTAPHPPRLEAMHETQGLGKGAANTSAQHVSESKASVADKADDGALMNSDESKASARSGSAAAAMTRHSVDSVVASADRMQDTAHLQHTVPSAHMSMDPALQSSESKASNSTRVLDVHTVNVPAGTAEHVSSAAALASEESNAAAGAVQEATGAVIPAASIASGVSLSKAGPTATVGGKHHMATSAESATLMAASLAGPAESKAVQEADGIVPKVPACAVRDGPTAQQEPDQDAQNNSEKAHRYEREGPKEGSKQGNMEEPTDRESQHSPVHMEVDKQPDEHESHKAMENTQGSHAASDAVAKGNKDSGKENIEMPAGKTLVATGPVTKRTCISLRMGIATVGAVPSKAPLEQLTKEQADAARDAALEEELMPKNTPVDMGGQRSHSLQSSTSSMCVASTTTSTALQTVVTASAGPNRSHLRPPSLVSAPAAHHSLTMKPSCVLPHQQPAFPTPPHSYGTTVPDTEVLHAEGHGPDAHHATPPHTDGEDQDAMHLDATGGMHRGKHTTAGPPRHPSSRSRATSPAPSHDRSPADLSPVGRADQDAALGVGKRRRKPSVVAMEAAQQAQQEQQAKHPRKPMRPGMVTPPKPGPPAHGRKRSISDGNMSDRGRSPHTTGGTHATGGWDASLQGALEALTAMQSPRSLSATGSLCGSLSDDEHGAAPHGSRKGGAAGAHHKHPSSRAGHGHGSRAHHSKSHTPHDEDPAYPCAEHHAAASQHLLHSSDGSDPAGGKGKSLLSGYSILDKLGEVGLADCFKQRALLGQGAGNELKAFNLLLSSPRHIAAWQHAHLPRALRQQISPRRPYHAAYDHASANPWLAGMDVPPNQRLMGPPHVGLHADKASGRAHTQVPAPRPSFVVEPPPPLKTHLPTDDLNTCCPSTATGKGVVAGKASKTSAGRPHGHASRKLADEHTETGFSAGHKRPAGHRHPVSDTGRGQDTHAGRPGPEVSDNGADVDEEGDEGTALALLADAALQSGDNLPDEDPESAAAADDAADAAFAPPVSSPADPPQSSADHSVPPVSKPVPTGLPLGSLANMTHLAQFLQQSAHLSSLQSAAATLNAAHPVPTPSRTATVQQLLPKVVTHTDPISQHTRATSSAPPSSNPLPSPLPLMSTSISSIPMLTSSIPMLTSVIPTILTSANSNAAGPSASTSLTAPNAAAMQLLEQQLLASRSVAAAAGAFSPRLPSLAAATFIQNPSIIAELMSSSSTGQELPAAMASFAAARPAADMSLHHAAAAAAAAHNLPNALQLPFFQHMPW